MGFINGGKGIVRDAYSPIQDVTDTALQPVRNVVGGIKDFDRLKQENEQLRQELDTARGQALIAEDAVRERDLLSELNDLTIISDIPSVTARVVAENPSNFQRAFVIDKGTSSGIANGMPVTTGAGLVGRIVDASDRRATVLLVTDPSSSVGVRIANTGEVGIASGNGDGKALSVDLLSVDSSVKVGDVFVTSGLENGLFPRQIPIGTVTLSEATAGALQRGVSLAPVVDLERVEFVHVLEWSAPK